MDYFLRLAIGIVLFEITIVVALHSAAYALQHLLPYLAGAFIVSLLFSLIVTTGQLAGRSRRRPAIPPGTESLRNFKVKRAPSKERNHDV